MSDLTYRPTVIGGDRLANDYCVYFEGRSIGRIKLAENHVQRRYTWRFYINPPIPTPSWADGSAESLDAALAAFRETWQQFYSRLTPAAIARWHQLDDASATRIRNGVTPNE